MTLTMDCDGADITTIEGLVDRATGELDRPAAGIFGQLRLPVRLLYPRRDHDGQSAAQ